MTTILISACSSMSNNKDLNLGKYVMQDGQYEDFAWVLLEEDQQFEFNRGSNTSYRPRGIYSLKDNEVILTVNDDEVYTFTIEDNNLIFKSGEFAKDLVPTGTVFEFTTK